MVATAAGFAALSALSPTALLVCAVYLGSAQPRRAMMLYLAGAITMTVLMGIIVLVAVRAGGLSLPGNRQPRYGLRLGLGVLALASGLYMVRRKPRPPDPARPKKPSLLSRMTARPGGLAAFVAGLIVFVPSAAFLAAVQAIATTNSSDLASALALAAVIAIDVILVWLPLLLYLARPEATTRRLKAFNGWLRAHGHAIVAGALLVAGAALTASGAAGLA